LDYDRKKLNGKSYFFLNVIISNVNGLYWDGRHKKCGRLMGQRHQEQSNDTRLVQHRQHQSSSATLGQCFLPSQVVGSADIQ
jgi:hypothetical protein